MSESLQEAELADTSELAKTLGKRLVLQNAPIQASPQGTGSIFTVLENPLSNVKGRDWVIIHKPGATLAETYATAVACGRGAAPAAQFGQES